MFMCAFILCLCCSVCRQRSCNGLITHKSYRLYKKDYETEEEVRAQQRAVEPLMNK
jgi:hypothetical protein